MNHASHMDWLYSWTVVREQGDLSFWKVITKDNIRNAPLFGPTMQCGCLLFIKRSWEKDEAEFRDKLDYFNSIDYPCQLLLFPEGGDFNSKSKEKSDSYADQNSLPHYKYCLHPRTKGFTYIMSKLRECGLDAVYDVTIAFPDTLPKTELDFVSGVIPRAIDFHIKSYEDSDIPQDEEDLGKWCQDRWLEKEEMLSSYYTTGTFEGSSDTQPSNGGNSRNEGPTNGERNYSVNWSQATYLVWLLMVNVIPGYLIYTTWGVFCSPVLTYCALSFAFTLWLSLYSVGFDNLLLLAQKRNTMEYLAKRRKGNDS